MKLRLESLLTGSVQPLGPRAAPSGIHKLPVTGRVWLSRTGFVGDEQGDTKHHGGPEKAVHHYAFDHYPRWRAELGEREVLRRPGAFGENFSTCGLTEKDVAVGDIFRVGQALIQVSQGRQPCWKLNHRFDCRDMAIKVQASGMTGWYYRVLEPGFVEPEDELALVDRITPEWTITRLWRALYVDTLNFDELAAMAALAHLPDGWRQYAVKRLATRQVEDWSRRLSGDRPSAGQLDNPPNRKDQHDAPGQS